MQLPSIYNMYHRHITLIYLALGECQIQVKLIGGKIKDQSFNNQSFSGQLGHQFLKNFWDDICLVFAL